MEKINLSEKLSRITEHWRPRVVAELNGQEVRVAKFKGELVVVPRGVEHRTVAEEEAEALIFEPAAVRNTRNVVHPTLTAPIGERG